MRSALLGAFFASVQAQTVPDFPSTLEISVTYRDFLPLGCFLKQNGVTAGEAALEVDWANTPVSGLIPKSREACDGIFNNAQNGASTWIAAFQNGDISGHPDFEAANLYKDQDDCTDINPKIGVAFPGGSCIFKTGSTDGDIKFSVLSRTLQSSDSGLPKPAYCQPNEDGSFTECGIVTEVSGTPTTRFMTQSNKENFDLWYVDQKKFNRRVGDSVVLNLQNANTGIYSFDSGGAFFPLQTLKNQQSLTDDPNKVKAWPETRTAFNTANGFWFTTELHTTFVFDSSRDMTFEFAGDDDFWAFVNGHMVIDLGGLHSSRTRKIDLLQARVGNLQTIQEFLGLEDGKTYTLDIFHAERETDQSNFKITTSLVTACTVTFSGSASFSSFANGISTSDFESEFFSDGVALSADRRSFTIQDGTDLSSTFIFTSGQLNVIRGFEATFDVTISGENEGFAFVVQGAGIDDYLKTGGSTLNLGGLTNSLAVVFDLCSDRDTSESCSLEQVRVHFPDDPSDTNDATSTATRRVFDSFMLGISDEEAHSVRIVYYGGEPDFLEVFVDGSLYLRKDNFEISSVIGTGGAFVGFTSSNTLRTGSIDISNFVLNTVQVDPSNTIISETAENAAALTTPQEVVADGVSTSDGISISTFDLCANQLESGTLGDLVTAKYIEIENVTTRRRRDFFNGSSTPAVVDAVVVDNNDGTYSLQLKTTVQAEFHLAIAFGEGCDIAVSASGVATLVPNGNTCFFNNFNNGQSLVVAIPPDQAPTFSPVAFENPDDNSKRVLQIAVGAGGLFILGLVVAIVLVRYRRKWERERKFIEQGNAFRLEQTTMYNDNNEYKETGKKLLESQKEILALKTAASVDARTEEIGKLKSENESMKTLLKQGKAKNVEQVDQATLNKPKKGKKADRLEF